MARLLQCPPAVVHTTMKTTRPRLCDRVLQCLDELGVRFADGQFDEVVTQAEKAKCSHLEFLERLLSPVAAERRQRSIERRIKNARFPEQDSTLEGFDWKFNPSIDRVQIEEWATGDFVRRTENLVFVGQSGLHL